MNNEVEITPAVAAKLKVYFMSLGGIGLIIGHVATALSHFFDFGSSALGVVIIGYVAAAMAAIIFLIGLFAPESQETKI